jgi:GT2 family glycosyltransferase
VVDDGSTDATAEVLARHPRSGCFEVVRLPNGGPSRARNQGVERARGELLAFFDSDCHLDPWCVEELALGLDRAEVASVGGSQRPPADQGTFGNEVQRYFEAVGFMTGYVQDGSEGAIVPTAHNPSCNVLYRRDVFDRLGGFDEGLWPGEDVDLDYRATRAGFCHRFNPRAVIYHYRPASPASLRRMFFSYGRAQMLLVRRYGPFRKLHAAALLAIAALPAVVAALFWRPVATASVLAVLGTAGLFGLERLRRRSRLGGRFYAFFLSNVGCWLGGFITELVWPRFRRRPALRR